MRRILPIILLVLAIGSLYAAAAWASDDSGSVVATGERAAAGAHDPFTTSSTAPKRDATHQGFVYGYRSSAALAADLEAAANPGRTRDARAGAASAGAGATIQITATVLPGVSVDVDGDGRVTKLQANTEQRDVRDVLIVVPRALDAELWAEIRTALGESRAGTGTIWTR